ncbi:MAG: hypothetical protein FWF88_01360 [Peptococcaceae bacterium]|nr:hypothetical protein [Peptococcaceae bacterium]
MRAKSRFFSLRTLSFSLGALVVLVLALMFFYRQMSESVQREGEQVARDAIIRALISCYATEGSYPASLDYLINHYGIVIDEKYVVNYVVFASNVFPEVTLTNRNRGTNSGKHKPGGDNSGTDDAGKERRRQ